VSAPSREEVEAQAVALAKEVGISEAARRLGLPKSSVGRWVTAAGRPRETVAEEPPKPREGAPTREEVQAWRKKNKASRKEAAEHFKIPVLLVRQYEGEAQTPTLYALPKPHARDGETPTAQDDGAAPVNLTPEERAAYIDIAIDIRLKHLAQDGSVAWLHQASIAATLTKLAEAKVALVDAKRAAVAESTKGETPKEPIGTIAARVADRMRGARALDETG